MLAGKMQFIPSVQLSRSPHGPDASVQQLRWHIEKRANRCEYERVAAVYVLLASLQTGSYLYRRRRCSHAACALDEWKILLLNTSPSQQHLSLIFGLA